MATKSIEHEVKEFYSVYMHLEPVAIAARIKARFAFGKGFDTGDWLDQMIQHICPKRAIVYPPGERKKQSNKIELDGIMDDKMPMLYKLEGTVLREDRRLETRELVLLCPVKSDIKEKMETIVPDKEDINTCITLYQELNSIENYKHTEKGVGYYRIFNRWKIMSGMVVWEERYVKTDEGIIPQTLNMKEYVYYRRKLAALMRGEVVMLHDEDTDTSTLAEDKKKSPQEIFTEKLKEIFPEIEHARSEKDYSEKYRKIEVYYKNSVHTGITNNRPNRNFQREALFRFEMLAESLLSYPAYQIKGSPFTVVERWHTEMEKAVKHILHEILSKTPIPSAEVLWGELDRKINSYGTMYLLVKNVDYYLEVNNITRLGKVYNEWILHFEIWSNDCIITNPKTSYEDKQYVLISDTEKDTYFNKHKIVNLMKNATIFTRHNFKSLDMDVINKNEYHTFYMNDKRLEYTVTHHLNSYAVLSEDEWITMMTKGYGIFEKNDRNLDNLRNHYFRFKWITTDIIKELWADKAIAPNNAGEVCSTFYHPVRFLAWLDNKMADN
jgi:hypothetical protein